MHGPTASDEAQDHARRDTRVDPVAVADAAEAFVARTVELVSRLATLDAAGALPDHTAGRIAAIKGSIAALDSNIIRLREATAQMPAGR